ncbi:hypothetical protein BSY16_4584 (plasmid) [Sinorhizobium sp. RAC02]|nr:hypothetical protein BSY16_4584 [Sinorhizobium sp. RAC02]
MQILPTSKSQKTLRKRCTAPCALKSALYQPHSLWIVASMLSQKLQISKNGHEQVVEVVGNTAG